MSGRRRGLPFTLLELFICIFILAMASVAVGVSIKGMYDQHIMESSSRRIGMKLRELQALALSYQTDMVLEIKQGKEGISIRASTDEPLPGFDRKWIPLKDGCRFTFQNGQNQSVEQLKITLGGTGWISPQGSLAIQRAKKGPLWIDFRLPLQIKLGEEMPKQKEFQIPSKPE